MKTIQSLDTVKLGQCFTFADDKRKTSRVYVVFSKSQFGVLYIDTITGKFFDSDYNSRVTYYKEINIVPTIIDVRPSKPHLILVRAFIGNEPMTQSTFGLSVDQCLNKFCKDFNLKREQLVPTGKANQYEVKAETVLPTLEDLYKITDRVELYNACALIAPDSVAPLWSRSFLLEVMEDIFQDRAPVFVPIDTTQTGYC